jgi:hypothetical protein
MDKKVAESPDRRRGVGLKDGIRGSHARPQPRPGGYAENAGRRETGGYISSADVIRV